MALEQRKHPDRLTRQSPRRRQKMPGVHGRLSPCTTLFRSSSLGLSRSPHIPTDAAPITRNRQTHQSAPSSLHGAPLVHVLTTRTKPHQRRRSAAHQQPPTRRRGQARDAPRRAEACSSSLQRPIDAPVISPTGARTRWKVAATPRHARFRSRPVIRSTRRTCVGRTTPSESRIECEARLGGQRRSIIITVWTTIADHQPDCKCESTGLRTFLPPNPQISMNLPAHPPPWQVHRFGAASWSSHPGDCPNGPQDRPVCSHCVYAGAIPGAACGTQTTRRTTVPERTSWPRSSRSVNSTRSRSGASPAATAS